MIKKERIISLIVTIILIYISHKLIESNNYNIESSIDNLSTEVLNSQANVLERTIFRNTKSATILGEHIKIVNGNMSSFDTFAKMLLSELKGVSNLQLAPDAVVKKIYPLEGNEKAIGHDLFKDDARKKEAFLTRKSHKLTLAGPFTLIQGGVGIIARKPIYINDKFWGFASALIILDDLIKNTNINELKEKNYIFRLKRVHPDTEKMDIFYGNKNFSSEQKVYTKSLKVPNGTWYLDIQYTGIYLSNSLVFILYFVSILISFLLGYLLFIILNRPRELEKLNDLLEKKVQEQTKKIQNNLDLIGTYVLYSRTDSEGIITEVSEAFCKLTGYSKDELIGKTHSILKETNYSNQFYENMWNTIKSGKTWAGELKNKAKSGHSFWVYSMISPEYDENNSLVGFIAIRQDITAKKTFEENQVDYFQNAKMVAMGEMIGNIAHQWRQPLSAISTLASGLIFEKKANIIDDENLYKKLGNIVEYTLHLSKTIDTFRDFLRVRKSVEKTNLEDRIIAAKMIIDATLKEKSIDLIDNIDYEKTTKVNLIIGQLEQVLLNIFNNAKDALLEKETINPWIKLELYSIDDRIIIAVEDNAGGIPEKNMPHIFEPYFTTKHQTLGTGLGLNMSYRIINESLKGNIYAKNTKNGAKFFIELPMM
ncbi:PAS domain S-box protein [Halarcobacter sp.]|uniref:PAS domain S-box protein n=1 Tax=Halarcobacter sp. TaxID=2321133 RepID=UPI002AA63FEA|nr:PAS domain S-box protein [Halarcobacter sp.]